MLVSILNNLPDDLSDFVLNFADKTGAALSSHADACRVSFEDTSWSVERHFRRRQKSRQLKLSSGAVVPFENRSVLQSPSVVVYGTTSRLAVRLLNASPLPPASTHRRYSRYVVDVENHKAYTRRPSVARGSAGGVPGPDRANHPGAGQCVRTGGATAMRLGSVSASRHASGSRARNAPVDGPGGGTAAPKDAPEKVRRAFRCAS